MKANEKALWIPVMVLGLHFMEEYALDFNGWAARALHIQTNWLDFNMVNFGVFCFMLGGAALGWDFPILALAGPALLLINAVIFHLGLSIFTGAYSPGTITALLFFIPSSSYVFYQAKQAKILTKEILFGSFGIGLFLQVFPFLLEWARRAMV